MTRANHADQTRRRLNRRTLVGGAAAASGLLVGGAKSSAYAAPMLNLRQSAITLEFWGGEPEENGPGDLVAAFNEANPDIQVRYTRYVNDDTGNTQLDTALQGGTPIDVYQSYGVSRASQRIAAGAALDLTPYIDADRQITEWRQTEQMFTYRGKHYSLPTVIDPYITIANQTMLEEAGLTLPETWTTDEFRQMAGELSGDLAYGTFAPQDLTIQILGPNRWYKGEGQESNFDHPAYRQSLELHRGMIEDGSAFPWTDVLARNLRVYQQNIFLTEQCGLWISSSFVLRYINDTEEFPHDFITTFGPVPTPAGAEDPWTLGTLSNEIMINPTTQNADAAWQLMRFRLVEGAYTYLEAGKQPAFPGTSVDDVVAGILGPDRETLYDVAAYKKAISQPNMRIPTDTITTASAEIAQIYQQQSDQYLIGEIDIEECVSEMKSQADAAIAEASA